MNRQFPSCPGESFKSVRVSLYNGTANETGGIPMKMLTTQITGLLQRIATSEEEAIGMTARLLAQATVGQGVVYFAAFGELGAVSANAIRGA
ncbi:DUF2529 family protein, partial [Bhargavaea cecembensis]|uniref:DUF2529 family protein n=1 Tax=Bhargavaea cecembensis TaxID=394098 RepID=UPI0027BA6BA7